MEEANILVSFFNYLILDFYLHRIHIEVYIYVVLV